MGDILYAGVAQPSIVMSPGGISIAVRHCSIDSPYGCSASSGLGLMLTLFHWIHTLGKMWTLVSDAEDEMDQSKWSLPRHREVQSSREASVLQRPRIKLHGVWLHGICLHLFAIHPGIPSDSSLIVECLLRAIEMARDVFKKEGRKFPDSLICWAPCLHPVNNFALSSVFNWHMQHHMLVRLTIPFGRTRTTLPSS